MNATNHMVGGYSDNSLHNHMFGPILCCRVARNSVNTLCGGLAGWAPDPSPIYLYEEGQEWYNETAIMGRNYNFS